MKGFCLAGLLSLITGCGVVSDYLAGTDNSAPPVELVDFNPTLSIQTLWSVRAGEGSEEQYLKLAPLVADGKVYVADREGRVGAYDAATGNSLWQAETESPISGGPGGGEGLILVGTRNAEVLALNETNGQVVWRAAVSSEVLTPPRAASGIVVARTVDGRLFGLDAQTGNRLWVYDSIVPVLTLRGISAPVLIDDKVIAGFANGKLAALTLSEGKLLWETSIAEPGGRTELERLVDISGEPRIADGIVYVAAFQGGVAAVEIDSGRVLWSREISSTAGLDIDAEQLYVSDENDQVLTLQRRDGGALWKQEKLQARAITAPVAYGDYVVVGDFEGYLHWMAQDDGRFVARVRVDDEGIIATPIVIDDTLYVTGRSGILTALRAS